MKRGRQSTTTPQALRQGNRAVAKQPDTQREGPAQTLGQDTTRDQPQGGGRQQETGEESQQQPRKGQTQRSPTTPREAHKGKRKRHPQKRRQKHKHNKKHHKQEPGTRGKETRNQGQTNGKESTAHTMNTQTNDQTTKRGFGPGGELDPKKAAKRPPPHSSKRGQITTRCPGTRGTGDQNGRKEKHETKGREEEGGGSLRHTPCSVFKVVLFI